MLLLLALTHLFTHSAIAQKKKKPDQPLAPVEVPIKTLPPAYNDKMLRLAEILGSIHYLRDLCKTAEGHLWRKQMENMIANEQPTARRKAELIGRFNRGYRTFREIHRQCTTGAAEAANRYLREGRRISGEIPDRYGRLP